MVALCSVLRSSVLGGAILGRLCPVLAAQRLRLEGLVCAIVDGPVGGTVEGGENFTDSEGLPT